MKHVKQVRDPALSCTSQRGKNSETVVPDAGGLEGAGETIYQGDLKDVLFGADDEGAKTFWRRTVVQEGDCEVCESSCTSEVHCRGQSRSGRAELGAGGPAALCRVPEGSWASGQMEKEMVGLNLAS